MLAVVIIAALWLLRDASADWSVTYRDMMRDPVSIAGLTPAHGLLSNLGVAVMLIAGAGAGLAAAAGVRPFSFGSVALLSIVFAFDDFFLFHETLAPAYLGLAEFHAVLIYPLMAGAVVLGVAIDGRRLWAVPLVCIGVLFAASLLGDLAGPPGSFIAFLDGAGKLAAIVAWAAFWLTAAVVEIRQRRGGIE
ncbi:MAG: hypothetical protein ACU0BS_05480 [Hasllibacter sp.]